MFQSSQSISFISFISFLNEIKFPFCTFFSTFPLASFIHRTKSPHYLARNKKKKKKPSFFFPIFITHSFTGVQQLLSTRVQAMKGIKGSDTRIGITFLPAPLFRFDHSVDAQSEIYRVSLSFETLLLSPPVSPGEQRAGVHLLILTRSNCQFALCYPAVLSKQYAPLAACLRINREHAPLFHPREAIPPPLPLSLVQSSRSKAFKVISVNWREKKLAHCRRWFSTIRQGLVSTVGKVLSTRFEIAEPVTESVTWKLRCLCSGMMDLMG